ncbi:hypothetical protein RFI_20214 [Reticulomyxa filosa]|uniref:Uncharacterized protein n=1 Tax=Reticulomyxa filosa TaxID=46433 RepID=X6MTD8_RETFI|nr:hypothetical protein RFI_20214 [Reticulomyxa filosa]|eukprot:ETO17119.1 hypothetical protein RFI_20214 [Reticulomyxa filosa]
MPSNVSSLNKKIKKNSVSIEELLALTEHLQEANEICRNVVTGCVFNAMEQHEKNFRDQVERRIVAKQFLQFWSLSFNKCETHRKHDFQHYCKWCFMPKDTGEPHISQQDNSIPVGPGKNWDIGAEPPLIAKDAWSNVFPFIGAALLSEQKMEQDFASLKNLHRASKRSLQLKPDSAIKDRAKRQQKSEEPKPHPLFQKKKWRKLLKNGKTRKNGATSLQEKIGEGEPSAKCYCQQKQVFVCNCLILMLSLFLHFKDSEKVVYRNSTLPKKPPTKTESLKKVAPTTKKKPELQNKPVLTSLKDKKNNVFSDTKVKPIQKENIKSATNKKPIQLTRESHKLTRESHKPTQVKEKDKTINSKPKINKSKANSVKRIIVDPTPIIDFDKMPHNVFAIRFFFIPSELYFFFKINVTIK